MWYLSVFSRALKYILPEETQSWKLTTQPKLCCCIPCFFSVLQHRILVVVHSVIDSFGTRKQKHCSCELKYVRPKSFRVTLGSFRRPCCGQPSSRSRPAAVEVCLSSISQRSRNREKPRRFVYVASNPGGPSWRSLW